MFPAEFLDRAAALVETCRAKGLVLATAESCTGGLVAALLTEIPGSSTMFDRGFVTYSNEAKQAMLGVPAELLARYGAVSEACARAMAEGAVANSSATMAVSITGIAGPGGGSDDKPVGLVHFGCSRRGGATTHTGRRFGDIGRQAVRLAAVAEALRLFEEAAELGQVA